MSRIKGKVVWGSDYSDFVSARNRRAAYLIGRGVKPCEDCGYRLCTCQTKLSEFEYKYQRMLHKAIIQSKGKNQKEALRRILYNLSKADQGFKEFLMRYGILKENE